MDVATWKQLEKQHVLGTLGFKEAFLKASKEQTCRALDITPGDYDKHKFQKSAEDMLDVVMSVLSSPDGYMVE